MSEQITTRGDCWVIRDIRVKVIKLIRNVKVIRLIRVIWASVIGDIRNLRVSCLFLWILHRVP